MRIPGPHAATVVGRLRTDPNPLVLVAAVVALATTLTSATPILRERAFDRAISAAVRDAGLGGAVVATTARRDPDLDAAGRDPNAAKEIRADADTARSQLPKALAAALRPGLASVTSSSLHLLGSGPGRYLRLAYLDSPSGGPAVRYVEGEPPGGTTSAGRSSAAATEPWPVEVAVSRATADALGFRPGQRLSTEDAQSRPVAIVVTGIFEPTRVRDPAWQALPQLVTPVSGTANGVTETTAGALVTARSVPDLRFGVPAENLTEKITFSPRPERVTWARTISLSRAIVSLKASPSLAEGDIGWDSFLDLVLAKGRAQISAADGQSGMLLVALFASALLVLLQSAELLVRRRARSIVITRERGATLLVIATELYLEAAAGALVGFAAGLLLAWSLVGGASWGLPLALPLLAALAAAVLGAVLAARETDPRRSPANRSARRRASRARLLRRGLLVVTVVAVAGLTYGALRQRGVLSAGALTPASAPTWWALAGALLAVPLVGAGARPLLAVARRARGGVPLFVAARVALARALPVVVLTVLVAELTFAVCLAATERAGQLSGAQASVGGDARLTTAPRDSLAALARRIAAAPGVRAASAGRVESGVPATSPSVATTVRLLVVDASDYGRLLARSSLPDLPGLGLLTRDSSTGVPALLLGGTSGLRDRLTVSVDNDLEVPLDIVGTGPAPATEPVIVVDATRFAAAGAATAPDTVWAVGPGAAAAVRSAARVGDTVATYAEALAARRAAPLASGLFDLAVATSVLLLVLSVVAVLLGTSAEAADRSESLARLRALGLPRTALFRTVLGELLLPVLAASLAGAAIGAGAARLMFGELALQRITGQPTAPTVALPWWSLPALLLALVAVVLVASYAEWRRRHSGTVAAGLRRSG